MAKPKLKDEPDDHGERDGWIAYSEWAFSDDAWHLATRYADLLGREGATALCLALCRVEQCATGREALALNEARLMLTTAIERRWN